jgi:hypothetical protein
MSEEEQQRLLTLLAQARTAMLLTPVAKIGNVLLENKT